MTALRLQARLSVEEGDATYLTLKRLMRAHERPSTGLRRAVVRYTQMLEGTPSPDSRLVMDIAELLMSERADLCNRIEYPSQNEMLEVIAAAAIEAGARKRLERHVAALPFAEYCKLVEAVEIMLARA